MTGNKSTGASETIDNKINNNSNSYKKTKWNEPHSANLTETFKGSNTELSGKIFTKGPTHVSIYNGSFKAILTYIGIKYDQRVYKSFEYKDKQRALLFLNKTTVHMITKIVQVGEISADGEYKVMGKRILVIDKDREDFVMYQPQIK